VASIWRCIQSSAILQHYFKVVAKAFQRAQGVSWKYFHGRKSAMDRLVAAANIQYFRERLTGATDEREVKDLRFLIAREECRLRDISSSKEQIASCH